MVVGAISTGRSLWGNGYPGSVVHHKSGSSQDRSEWGLNRDAIDSPWGRKAVALSLGCKLRNAVRLLTNAKFYGLLKITPNRSQPLYDQCFARYSGVQKR
jgi:hypothetical protein